MSPFEHEEVFVLDYGGEAVMEKERQGDFLEKTVQVVPHITDAIQDWIGRVALVPVDGLSGSADVCVTELDGTISTCLALVASIVCQGDEVPSNPCLSSKLSCRSNFELPLEEAKEKLSQVFMFHLAKGLLLVVSSALSMAEAGHILYINDVSNIGHIPLLLRDQQGHQAILRKLQLRLVYAVWICLARCSSSISEKLVAPPPFRKMDLACKDFYGLRIYWFVRLVSLGSEVFATCFIACSRKLLLEWVAATDLEDCAKEEAPEAYDSAWNTLKKSHDALVPNGFGDRGVQGKILAATYVRSNGVSYLGIWLGMQLAVVEFARNILGLKNANSTEFDSATPFMCFIMPEVSETHMGGTMRLGGRKILL
uniref:CTP synthase n=1 Tax=Physcomitrium patens TaxID=3218 RepID=A0A2K1JMF5_PHYPA|nr:hypothetical protein PHYPA_017548 [Physcomitrium patens]